MLKYAGYALLLVFVKGSCRARCWYACLPPSLPFLPSSLRVGLMLQSRCSSQGRVFFYSLTFLLAIGIANAAGGCLRYRKVGLGVICCSADLDKKGLFLMKSAS
jgi:hypothetical protein